MDAMSPPTPNLERRSKESGQVSWLVALSSPAPSHLAAVAVDGIAPHLQWRARAGFAPASLFSP